MVFKPLLSEVLRRLVSWLYCSAIKFRLPDALLPRGQVQVLEYKKV